jgi:hypothetical protein
MSEHGNGSTPSAKAEQLHRHAERSDGTRSTTNPGTSHRHWDRTKDPVPA